MALLQRTVTPARLEANRRSAQRSTGPRTARTALNALRTGARSRTANRMYYAIFEAPPGGVLAMARSIMTPSELAHPYAAYMLDKFRSPDDDV